MNKMPITFGKTEPKKLSPVEFKLLFSAQEGADIAASTDPVVKHFFSIVDDPRLTYVDLGLQNTIDGVNYLETLELIGPGRAAEVLTG